MRTEERVQDRGFSLPELIITMMLLGVAMTLIVGLFVTFSSIFNREREATANANQASLMMDAGTKVIKSGTPLGPAAPGSPARSPFVAATSSKLELYSNVSDASTNIKPTLVRLEASADGKLIESRWAARSTSEPWTFAATSTTPTHKRIIGSGLKTGSTVFSYHSGDGILLPTPVSTVNLGRIATVTMTVTVETGSGRNEPLVVSSRTRLPNLPVDG